MGFKFLEDVFSGGVGVGEGDDVGFCEAVAVLEEFFQEEDVVGAAFEGGDCEALGLAVVVDANQEGAFAGGGFGGGAEGVDPVDEQGGGGGVEEVAAFHGK